MCWYNTFVLKRIKVLYSPSWFHAAMTSDYSTFTFWTHINWVSHNHNCYYSLNFFSNHVRSHWLLRGHMKSNNDTVSSQNLWAWSILLQNLWRERVTVHCYQRMLTDDRRYSEVSVIKIQLQNLQLSNKLLKDWSLWKHFILFPSTLNVFLSSASGNIKILGKQN